MIAATRQHGNGTYVFAELRESMPQRAWCYLGSGPAASHTPLSKSPVVNPIMKYTITENTAASRSVTGSWLNAIACKWGSSGCTWH